MILGEELHMKKRIISLLALIFATVSLLTFSAGCDLEAHKKNDSYVSDVKNLVNDTVNYTRRLKQQDEAFESKDSEKLRGYLLAADDLINTLEQIQKLRPTDEFDEMNDRLRTAAEAAMNNITQIRSFVAYASESGDDGIYKREKENYLQNYMAYYDEMKELSSEIQTYWRNA